MIGQTDTVTHLRRRNQAPPWLSVALLIVTTGQPISGRWGGESATGSLIGDRFGFAQPISQADDPGDVGNALRDFGVRLAQPVQCLADDLQLAPNGRLAQLVIRAPAARMSERNAAIQGA